MLHFGLLLALVLPRWSLADEAPPAPEPAEAADLEVSAPAAPPAAVDAPSPSLDAVLASIRAVSVADRGQPFLWKITGKAKRARGTVWLSGSVHVGRPELYPMPPEIDGAYAASARLGVEMDLSDPEIEARMGRELMQVGTLPEGQTLRDLMPERYEELKAALWRLGIPMVFMDRQTPFIAAMTLSVAEMMRAGWSPDLGIDQHYLTRARADGKPIVELEGLDRQLAVFRDMPMDAQVAMLGGTLDMQGATDAWTAKAWEAIRMGDTEALMQLRAIDEPDDDPDYVAFDRALLGDRNREMSRLLSKHVREAADAMFVIVGALHVPGDDGIVAELRKDKRLIVERASRP